MPTESTVTAAATAPYPGTGELYQKIWRSDPPGRKKILEKGTLTPEERAFLSKKKKSTEKKLMSGAYESLYDMATDINDSKPSKEIDSVIFKNMKICCANSLRKKKGTKMIFC